jgi:hypothetical protein
MYFPYRSFVVRCSSMLIVCSDGTVEVSACEAAQMAANCDFFRAIFAYGTSETTDGIIDKHDWTTKTALSLVKLLNAGAPGSVLIALQDLFDLACAADQLLIPLRVVPPSGALQNSQLGGTDGMPISDFINEIAGDWSVPSVWSFQVRSSAFEHERFSRLIGKGIVLEEMDGGVLVRRAKVASASGPERRSRFGLHPIRMSSLTFGLAGAAAEEWVKVSSRKLSVSESILATREVMAPVDSRQDLKVFTSEEISLRIPCDMLFSMSGVGQCLMEGLNKKGIRGYVHNKSSQGYYLNGGQQTCPTFFGTFKQLHVVLGLFPCDLCCGEKRCALRVGAPTSGTLSTLLSAITKCKDNPSTLGLDVSANAFFAVKTLADMKLVLHHASGEQPASSLDGIRLVTLTYPKGVF